MMTVHMLIMVVFAWTENGELESEAYGRPFQTEEACIQRAEEMILEDYPAQIYLSCQGFEVDGEGELVL